MAITNPVDLDNLVLKKGNHNPPSDGDIAACVMEAVAFVAGEPWSDHPACASKVLGAFLRSWNDVLPDEDRQMAMDWLVRDYTPAWLRAAKLDAQADIIAGLPEFKAGMDVPSVKPAIEAARAEAAAAWAAAEAAAWDAARAAARAALRPTVVGLQASAHRLVDRMLAVTESEVAA